MKHHLTVFTFYTLLACLALYMPILHIDTHLPGTPTAPVTDFFHFHWNYWWMRHALTTPDLNVYETNYVMAPYTTSLAYHTLTPFWFPIWALVEPIAGTVAAMTVIVVTAMALAGYTFYWLLRRERVSSGLALVGGAMLMLSPMMLNGVFWTNVNLMGWFWIPALILLWDRLVQTNKRFTTEDTERTEEIKKRERKKLSLPSFFSASSVVSLALALWGMLLVDLQYALFAAFIVVPYGLLTLWQARPPSPAGRERGSGGAFKSLSACGEGFREGLILYALLAVLIALALLWFVGPLPYVLDYDRSVLTSTPADAAIPIRFPNGYLSHLDDVWIPVSLGAVLMPLLALALILNLVARQARIALPARRWFWLALVPIPLILSAGASITVAGAEIPLPYVWLHDLFGGMFRYPERFAPVLLIPAVIFTMQTLTPLIARRPTRASPFPYSAGEGPGMGAAQTPLSTGWRGVGGEVSRRVIPVLLLLIVMLDSRVFHPFPIQPIPTPYHFYEVMGEEAYDYVVLEVPTGASSGEGLIGEPIYATTQFYGITHGKRMINGHFSRVDPAHFWYLRTDEPLLSWLGQRILLDPDKAERRLRKIIHTYPVGYIVVHTDLIVEYTGRSTVQEVIGYLNGLPELVCPVFVEGPAVVYRTVWHPDGCPPRTPIEIAPGVYGIDVGSSGDEPYLGWGWHWQEEIVPGVTARWTGQFPQADVTVQLPPGEYTAGLAVQSYQEPRTLRLLVNGREIGQAEIKPDSLQEVTFVIPAELTSSAQFLTLALDYGETLPVAGADRGLALLVDRIWFERPAKDG